MIEVYKALFFLVLGIALDQIIFPRSKTTNVQGDQVNDPKIKDNRKIKNRNKGALDWLIGSKEKREERQKSRQAKRILKKQNKALDL
jgi:hypothetical protein